MDTVRLDNLRWRLSACDHIEQESLPPPLRGLVTDTAMLSGGTKADPCFPLRSHSWDSRKLDAGSRKGVVRAVRSEGSTRLCLHPAVSFDPNPPVEVPTFVCRAVHLVRKRPCKKNRSSRHIKAHRCSRSLRKPRLLPNSSCFAIAARMMWQVRDQLCVFSGGTGIWFFDPLCRSPGSEVFRLLGCE